MTRSRSCFASAMLVAGMIVAGCRPPVLDHFRVYDVEKLDVREMVRLQGQFDSDRKVARLVALTHFANPTRKGLPASQVGVTDANAHLTWYALEQAELEPRRTVRFRNQFGQHSVDILTPRFLLVPTQKASDTLSGFPDNLDHYKCYEVVRVNVAPALPVVTLGDQFATNENVQVGPPRLFCLPVMKQREGEDPQRIKNPVDHLAVYTITSHPEEREIRARDQFGERTLKIIRSVFLAVPSEKQAVAPQRN